MITNKNSIIDLYLLSTKSIFKVLPEAVRDNGEYLTIDESRVFFETTAAAQELQRLTGLCWILNCRFNFNLPYELQKFLDASSVKLKRLRRKLHELHKCAKTKRI